MLSLSVFISITVQLYLSFLESGLPKGWCDDVKKHMHNHTHIHAQILSGPVGDMTLYIHTKALRVLDLMSTQV